MPVEPFTVLPGDPEHSFFRVIESDQPEVTDFYSDEAAGKLVDIREIPSWAMVRGFSVRATLPQARSLARTLGRSHIAELALDGQDGSAVARTGRTRGHHTVWVKPETALAEHVRRVHSVTEAE